MKARRILLTGTGGVGKRSIGAVLAVGHGFRHLEADGSPAPDATERLLLALLEAAASAESVVVTWSGNCPDEWVEILYGLRFDWFWLDSDRGAGRPRPIRRPDARPIAAPRSIDAFEEDGSFRRLDDVVHELIDQRHGGTRRGRRRLVPVEAD